jgi:hypothetical protein
VSTAAAARLLTPSAAADARLPMLSAAADARLLRLSAAADARLLRLSLASAARFWLDSSASLAMLWALSARSSAASRIAAIADAPAASAELPIDIGERLLDRTISAIRPISAAPAAAEMSSALVGSLRAKVETAAICGWIRCTAASACSRSFCIAVIESSPPVLSLVSVGEVVVAMVVLAAGWAHGASGRTPTLFQDERAVCGTSRRAPVRHRRREASTLNIIAVLPQPGARFRCRWFSWRSSARTRSSSWRC